MKDKPITGNSSFPVEWQDVCQLRSELYSQFGSLLLEAPDQGLIDRSSQGFWAQFPLAAANFAMEAGLHQLTIWSSRLVGEEPDMLIGLRSEFVELFVGPGKRQ